MNETFCEKNCEQRQQEQEAKAARAQWHTEHAPILGKWLWIHFWLFAPGLVSALMKNIDKLAFWGDTLSLITGLAGCFILWRLRNVERRYQKAAICGFAGFVLVIPLNWIPTAQLNRTAAVGVLLSLVPLLVLALYTTYQQYTAHAEVLAGLDDTLAGKWRRLWKWHVGFLAGLLGCILLGIVSAVLGMLALLACAIGFIVVSILSTVYLYRTAQLFRNFTEEREALPDETTL